MQQDILKTPIINLDQAKRYFYAMGGSHFHMARESTDRYKEYCALNIDDETEKRWLRENLDKIFSNFSYDNKNAWITFGFLCEKVTKETDYMDKVVDIAEKLIVVTPQDSKRLILVSIIGNNGSKSHGGLIESVFNNGRNDLVKRLTDICINTFQLLKQSRNTENFTRGYFVDVAEELNLNVDKKILSELRNKDNECLFHYYKDGAENGNIFSMYKLGMHYSEGKGCVKDIEEAKKWLNGASLHGNEASKTELQKNYDKYYGNKKGLIRKIKKFSK